MRCCPCLCCWGCWRRWWEQGKGCERLPLPQVPSGAECPQSQWEWVPRRRDCWGLEVPRTLRPPLVQRLQGAGLKSRWVLVLGRGEAPCPGRARASLALPQCLRGFSAALPAAPPAGDESGGGEPGWGGGSQSRLPPGGTAKRRRDHRCHCSRRAHPALPVPVGAHHELRSRSFPGAPAIPQVSPAPPLGSPWRGCGDPAVPTFRTVCPVLPSVVLRDVKGIRGDSDAPDPPGGAGGSLGPGGGSEPRAAPLRMGTRSPRACPRGGPSPAPHSPAPRAAGAEGAGTQIAAVAKATASRVSMAAAGTAPASAALGWGARAEGGSAVGWERGAKRGGGARGAEVSMRDTEREEDEGSRAPGCS